MRGGVTTGQVTSNRMLWAFMTPATMAFLRGTPPPPASPFPRVSMALAAETIHYLLTHAGPPGLSTADLADATGMSANQVGTAMRRLRREVRSYSTGLQEGPAMGRRSRWTLRRGVSG